MSKIDDARARTKTPPLTSSVYGVTVERLFCDKCGVTTWYTEFGSCMNCMGVDFLAEMAKRIQTGMATDKTKKLKTYYQWAVVRMWPKEEQQIEDDGEFTCIFNTEAEAHRAISTIKERYTKSENRKFGRLRVACLRIQEV